MWIVFSELLLFFTIITSFLAIQTTSTSPALHLDELNVLEEIAITLGIKRLNVSYKDPCLLRNLTIIKETGNFSMNNAIVCDCNFNNSMTCHITELILKSASVSGKLPPELAKLKYLQNM
ncbi:hypothetical protein N665_1431s0004 [Sinapis alba]|nr:hypothetical protein N665_1431s0004 [Sinapis alba]